MARREHASETPATRFLRQQGVVFAEHIYDYVDHGGALHSAQALGVDPFAIVKTLVMEDEQARPLLVLMHGNRNVSTKSLARQIGARSVRSCAPEVASRHTGYLLGGTSPFGTRKKMPVVYEQSIATLATMLVNGGKRGYLVELEPASCLRLLDARPVHCALAQ